MLFLLAFLPVVLSTPRSTLKNELSPIEKDAIAPSFWSMLELGAEERRGMLLRRMQPATL
jgi:hypothetical protein